MGPDAQEALKWCHENGYTVVESKPPENATFRVVGEKELFEEESE